MTQPIPFADFLRHIADPAPAFRCFACGDENEEPVHVALVEHELEPPAGDAATEMLRELLGPAAAGVEPLYRQHDGVLLYCDAESDAAGFALFPIEEWTARSAEMREQLAEMGWELDDTPLWLREGLAIGEVPFSGNFFVMHPAGADPHRVYYVDHDAFEDAPITANLEALLDWLSAEPANLLYQLGCYTRYSDGETDTQWIPAEYIPNAAE